jgi:hypothetical protein
MNGDGATMRDRLLQALDMFEFGVALMESNLRRKYPGSSPEQIELLLDAWLAAVPGPRFDDDEDTETSDETVATKPL